MAGRQVFSEMEKACLRELIIKYKLNTTGTIGAGNPNVNKIAWVRLTEEYNSIENNSKVSRILYNFIYLFNYYL